MSAALTDAPAYPALPAAPRVPPSAATTEVAGGASDQVSFKTWDATEIRLLRPDVPIVLMSGFAGPQVQERVQTLGIRDLLRKPLQRKDLAECFRRVLSS